MKTPFRTSVAASATVGVVLCCAAATGEVVDKGPGVGQYCSIALDSAGNAHIAYWAGGDRNLLLYAFKHGAKWEVRGVDAGVYVGASKSILLIRDVPHIVYTDGRELRHAWRHGRTWKKYVIDKESFWTGGGPQAVADKDGTIHVVYLERKGGRAWAKLKYAAGRSGSWKTETIVESREPNYKDVLFSKMVQYRNPSICVAEDGMPCVSYNAYSLDGATNRLEVAVRVLGKWAGAQIADGGRYSSIAARGGHISVAYTSGKTVRYGESIGEGPSWSEEEVIDDRGQLGWYVKLAAKAGTPHVGYYDLEEMSLKHAWKDGGQWRKETVAAGGDVGSYTSMALGADGKAHFACHDREKSALVYLVGDGRGAEVPAKPQVAGVPPNSKGDTVIDRDTTWRGLDLVLDGDVVVKSAKLLITCSTLRFTSGHGILCCGQGPLRRGVMPRCDGNIDIRNNSLITPAEQDGYTGVGFAGQSLRITDSTLERMRTLRAEWGFNYRAGIALHNPGRFLMKNTVYRECPSPHPLSRDAFRGIYMGRSDTPVEMRNNILYNLGRVQAVYARKMRYIGNVVTSDKPVPPHSLTPCFVQDGLYAYNYVGEHQDHGGFNLTLGSSHVVFRHNEQGLFSSHIFNATDTDLWVEDELSSYSGGFVHRAGGVGCAGIVLRNCVAEKMKVARLDASFNARGVVAEGLSGDNVQVLLDGAPDGWVTRCVGPPVSIALYPQRSWDTGSKLSPRGVAFLGLTGTEASMASCESNINFIDLRMKRVIYEGRNKRRAVRFINLNPDAQMLFKDREKPYAFYGYPEDYTGWSLADEHTPYWYCRVKVLDRHGRPVEGARVKIVNEVVAGYVAISRKGEPKEESVTGKDGRTSSPGNWPYRWEDQKATSDYFALPAGQQIEFGGWMKLAASPAYKYVEGWIVLEEYDKDKGLVGKHKLSAVHTDERPSQWRKLERKVTTSSCTAYGRVALNVYSGDGEVWFDELYVKTGEKNLVPNGNFEQGPVGWTEPDGVLRSLVEGGAKEGRYSYRLRWSFFGNDDGNVVCLPDYLLKGDGSRRNFTFTITAEKDGRKGTLRCVNPTAAWYSREPQKAIKELVVRLGEDTVYATEEKEPLDSGPRPGIVLAEVREPRYEKKDLLPPKLTLDPKRWKRDGHWEVKDGILSGESGSIQFLPYTGADCCVEIDVKDPGDPYTKMGILFRASDGNHYVFWFGVQPYRNAVLDEVRNKAHVTRKGFWTFVTPPPGKWFRVRLEVGGGTIRLSFDDDLDGDFNEPIGRAYRGPITYTTRDPAFHTGPFSRGRAGLTVDGQQEVLFRNFVLYGDKP